MKSCIHYSYLYSYSLPRYFSRNVSCYCSFFTFFVCNCFFPQVYLHIYICIYLSIYIYNLIEIIQNLQISYLKFHPINYDFQAILKLSHNSNTLVLDKIWHVTTATNCQLNFFLIIRWDCFIIKEVKLAFMAAFRNELGPFVNEIDRWC